MAALRSLNFPVSSIISVPAPHRWDRELNYGKRARADTYVEWLLENYPSRFGLDFKVIQVGMILWRREGVDDGSIVIRILIGGRDAENIRTNARILFHILDVFLRKSE